MLNTLFLYSRFILILQTCIPNVHRSAISIHECTGVFPPSARLTACNSMFRAAFMSRSWCTPQCGQVHSRTDNGIALTWWPHAQHFFVDAAYFGIWIICLSSQMALYFYHILIQNGSNSHQETNMTENDNERRNKMIDE